MTVTFYSDKLRALPAEIHSMQRIDENPRGLAVLRVTGPLPKELTALKWGKSDTLQGGEAVDFVGFPRSADTPWAVTSGRVSGWKGEISHVVGDY